MVLRFSLFRGLSKSLGSLLDGSVSSQVQSGYANNGEQW